MAETLIIRLGTIVDDKIHWLIWSEPQQEIIASGELTHAEQLSDLTEKCKQRKIVVLVPGSDVTLKSLNVPAKSQRAIKKVVPFMLEDELSQDVDQLFFAYSNHKASDEYNCFIAVVDKALMENWLAWLAKANIPVKVMMPDVLALPESEHWQMVQLEQQILVRQGKWQALAIDEQVWPMISANLANALSSVEEQTLKIQSYSTIAESELIIEQMPEELPLALMAQHCVKQSFNLLQDEFKVSEQRSPLVKTWSWAAGIFVVALLVNIAHKSVHLLQLSNQQQALEQQIIDTYKDAFPETKRVRVSTIRSQLKRKMAAIGRDENANGFLAMLSQVQPAFVSVPQLKPSAIRFDGKRNEIRIQATGTSYQNFEQFKQQLERQSLTVSQGAQNNQGDKISGSFSIIDKSSGGRS